MLKFNLVLILFLWLLPLTEPASPAQIDPIVSAIQGGSSSDLARYFFPTISLNINGQQGEYSKNQAEIVLKDFFKKNTVISLSQAPKKCKLHVLQDAGKFPTIYRLYI